jgi:hypothetical protein
LGNAGAKSRLVGDSGPSFDLEPEVGVSNLVPRVLVGFAKPAVVLKPGAEYTVTAEGLVDFAGNAGTPPAPRRVAAIAPAPLVPEDGFEQATGPSLGGASVVTANAITGTKSLYFGFSGAPSLGGVAPGGSLLVRLALQPSDRVVRFSYRIVGFDKEAAGPATFATIGSVGGQIVSQSIPYGGLYPLGDVYLGPVELLVVPLPADAAGEIVVGLATQFTCGSVAHPGAMLVDELRAEPQP